MRQLPRVAVGNFQAGAHPQPAVWGLLAALQQAEERAVLFQSSCQLSAHDVSQTLFGRAERHLDSWAMSRADARLALARAAGERETAIIAGSFAEDQSLPGAVAGVPTRSSLNRLCEWLELPRLAIVDVRLLAQCQMASLPPRTDAILLDRVADWEAAAYWQTTLEALWKTPVLGWLDDAAALRSACHALPAGVDPPRELCLALGERLLKTLRIEAIRALARRAPPLPVEPESEPVVRAGGRRRFRIAVAYDQAYCSYFPETLELLEAAGAELCDFSPLSSESIPAGTDIVYFGCGHPERQPERLAANHCLKQSLRCFAARGGRVYAEGSGLAYLCREIAFPCGRTIAMTGLLPAIARWLPGAGAAEPTEIVFGAPSWLAPASAALRGYRHTGWQIEPRGAMITYARDARQRLDLLGRGNVIGSRILINLAANRHLLRCFFEPYAPVGSAALGF
jgi:cobyrinic acid a,c-diamide synthase